MKCKTCNIPVTDNHSFCSRTCYDIFRANPKRILLNVICSQCGQKIQKYRNKRNIYFCDKKCKDLYYDKIFTISCVICGKLTQNEKYCSEACHYIGLQGPKLERSQFKCILCNKEFISLKTRKYCSRTCKDQHQKELYSGEGNPAFGKIPSIETKEKLSNYIKDCWDDPEQHENRRQQINKKKKEYFDQTGHGYGWDEIGRAKRKKTHKGFETPGIKEKCNKTCLERYGKTSDQIARSKIRRNSEGTYIERKTRGILQKNNFNFIEQLKLYPDPTAYKYKKYDFLLIDFNIIIEADGDYHHGHPDKFKDFDDLQLRNIANDIFKNKLAIDQGFKIIRFWGSDINKKDFEDVFLVKIQDTIDGKD